VRFREGYPLKAGSTRGYAKLTVNKSTLKIGEPFTLSFRFRNTGKNGRSFYNPLFNSLISLPAQLVIYDSNKKFIEDLLRFHDGSQRTVEAGDWTFIPPNTNIGTVLGKFKAGYVSWEGHELPPGYYYFQMIYQRAFIQSEAELTEEFDGSELFRSNVVKMQFVK